MTMEKSRSRKIIGMVIRTTAILVALIAVCFSIILGIMIKSYKGGVAVSEDIIGTWDCVQFYKNQKSFSVPDNQELIVTIDSGSVKMHGSDNASILRGEHSGTYTIEGGSVLLVQMGEDIWSCSCVFTQDGLLRLTISEMQVVLYLEKR